MNVVLWSKYVLIEVTFEGCKGLQFPVMTFPRKKRINTELFIGGVLALLCRSGEKSTKRRILGGIEEKRRSKGTRLIIMVNSM